MVVDAKQSVACQRIFSVDMFKGHFDPFNFELCLGLEKTVSVYLASSIDVGNLLSLCSRDELNATSREVFLQFLTVINGRV